MRKSGFTKVNNEIKETIMFSKFGKRQQKILSLIERLTYGCHKELATIKKSEFRIIGIYPQDAKKELKALSIKKVIIWNEKINRIGFNENVEEWKVLKVKTYDEGLFRKILNKNLTKYLPAVKQNAQSVVSKSNNLKPLKCDHRTDSKHISNILKRKNKEIKNGVALNKSFEMNDVYRLADELVIMGYSGGNTRAEEFVNKCRSEGKLDKLTKLIKKAKNDETITRKIGYIVDGIKKNYDTSKI